MGEHPINLSSSSPGSHSSGIVATNVASRAVALIVTRALGIFSVALLARFLGREGFGDYAFVVAYLAFFRLIGNLGLDPILVKMLSTTPPESCRRIVGNALIIKMLLSALAIGSADAAVAFMPVAGVLRYAIFISAFSLMAIADVYAAIFQAKLRLWIMALGESLEQLLWAGTVITLVAMRAPFLTYFLAMVLGSVGRLTCYWLMGRDEIRPAFCLDLRLWWEWVRQGWSLALLSFFSITLLRVDQLMLFKLRGARELGLYAASVRISEPWVSIAGILTSAIYPLMCRQYAEGDPSFSRTYQLCYKYLMAFIAPVAIGVAVLAKDVLMLLYGMQYTPASAPLALLMGTQVLMSLETFTVYILIAVGLQRIASAATIVAALANIGLNVLLLPRFGATGAAVAYFAAYLIYFAVEWLWSGSRPYLSNMARRALVPFAASGVMATAMAVVDSGIYWKVGAGLGVYAVTLIALRGFSWREVRILSLLSMKRETLSTYVP